ncbi:MAG: TonB-dependent receptor plug domain-containing protein [Phenylobacterium sp.]|uniref:TonB-dependent receptor plug domain-containing protein n=1 Tax=Phenylobacterium sp. TaxID=1871053 RepID=UPI00391BFCC6
MTAKSVSSLAGYVGLLLASAAIPSLALAAEDADGPRSNEVSGVEVIGRREVVTATAIEAVEYGNAVQIVTAEDVRVSGATNFAELAQFLVKGVNIGYSPDEGEYTIRLDGGGDRDTLVVRDGVPLYDRGPALEDIWGSTTIDPHMIETMEVFRGGNSLFFGSNGGIGVVSLVSKRPDGSRKGEFGVSYGSFETREIWGNYSFPIDEEGRHSLMFYGSMLATDGPRIFNPDDLVDNVRLAGGQQDYPLNRNEIGVKYLWKISEDTELRLNGEYTESWFQDSFPSSEIHSPNTVRYPIFDAALDHRWSEHLRTEVAAYYSNPKIWNTELYPDICLVQAGCKDPATGVIHPFGEWSGLVFAAANHGYGASNERRAGFKEMGLTMRNTVAFEELGEAVAGVQIVSYHDDSAVEFPVPDDTATTTGFFVDVRPRIPFSPSTKLSLAVRTDILPSEDSETIWKFGLRQPLPWGFYVRANGGTSYSLPRNTELFNETLTVKGNPDLQAEHTETYNAGVGFEGSYGDIRVGLEVSGFKTEITDRIRTTTGFPVPPEGAFDARNTYYNDPALTKILGATADLNVAIGDAWKVNLGYTSQDASADSGLQKGEQIGETPAWFWSGTVSWTSPDRRWNVAVMPRVQGSEWATGGLTIKGRPQYRTNFGNYAVVNATINYFMGKEMQHQLQLRIVNLLDEDYAERYGFGNLRYSQAYARGQVKTTDPSYYYGYPFEGKPRSFYLSFSTRF